MAFLYALLIGGFAALLGSGSGSEPAAAMSPRQDDDENNDNDQPAVEAPPVVDVIEEPQADPIDEPVAEDMPPAAPSAPSAPTAPNMPPPPPADNNDQPDLPDSAYDIGWAGLSAEEQLIVEMVNRARLDPASELGRQDPNEGFAAGVTTAPKEALAVVATLSDAAEAHSEDMDNQNYFSHTGLDGSLPWDRAQEAGHSNGYVGENIGWVGSSRAPSDVQARAEGHHNNLWDSDGHQQNFMSESWSEIGVGYDYGSYQGYNGSTFVTELFGDTGKTYLTGVVTDDLDDDGFYDVGEGQGDVRITAYNGDDAYGTATWDAGGYSLALPPGTYRVVFEGGDLDVPYETEVTIGNENVKLDVIEDNSGRQLATLNASVSEDTAALAALYVDPPLGEDMGTDLTDDGEDLPELAMF